MPPVPSIAAVADIAYASLTVAQTQLNGSGSSAGSGASVTNYTWQLIYKPPGSAAALADSGTDSQPYLNNIDKPGTYLVFLVVQNNLGTSSETNKFLAKDSAFLAIRAKTRYLALKIPAGHERNWADIVYTNHVAFDNLYSQISVWDTTHRLYFTTGNDAEIQDNRAANAKANKWGLKITSTTGINTAGNANYSGLHIDPTNNAGNAGGGGGVSGVHINFVNQAIDVVRGEKVLKAVLRTASSASHDGISISDDAGGWNLSYAKILTTSFKGRSVKVHHKDQTYPIAGVWGAALAETSNLNTTQANMWFDGISAGRLVFDLRTTSSSTYTTAAPDNGLITVATRMGAGAATTEQDLMLARITRFDDAANSWLGDTGIGYSEAEIANDATKKNTWFIRSLAPVANGGQDRGIVSMIENRGGNIVKTPKPLIVRGYDVVTASADAGSLSSTVQLHTDLFNAASVNSYTIYVQPVAATLTAATQKWGFSAKDVKITHTLNPSNQQITFRLELPKQQVVGSFTSSQTNVAAGAVGANADINLQVGGTDTAGVTPYKGASTSLGNLVTSFNAFTGSSGGGSVLCNSMAYTMNSHYLSSVRVKVLNADPAVVMNGNVEIEYMVTTTPYFHNTDSVTFSYTVVCEGRY